MFNHICTKCQGTFETPENNPFRVHGPAAKRMEQNNVANCFCCLSHAVEYVKSQPAPILTPDMTKALNFAKDYPGWHSFTQDAPTVTAIFKLREYNLVELSTNTNQFKAKESWLWCPVCNAYKWTSRDCPRCFTSNCLPEKPKTWLDQ